VPLPFSAVHQGYLWLLGILTDTPSMATHFFQDLNTFEPRFNLLQEVMIFLQEVSGLSTGISAFLQETSYRAFGQEKIDSEKGFKA